MNLQSLPDFDSGRFTDLLTGAVHSTEAGQLQLDLGGKARLLLHRRCPDVAG
jgi:hypothetical protein